MDQNYDESLEMYSSKDKNSSIKRELKKGASR